MGNNVSVEIMSILQCIYEQKWQIIKSNTGILHVYNIEK